VDDNIDTCRVLSRLLARDGFDVSCVHRGDEALKQLRENHPRLVLLDWMMPDMDGLQVLREMRQDHGLDQVAVIMFSALSEPTRIGDALRLGADDYIVKGTPYTDVLSRLVRVTHLSDV